MGIDLNSSVGGTIDAQGDEDYFKIALSEASGVLIYTTGYAAGFLQTTGELLDSNGMQAKADDRDSTFRQHGPQLFLWDNLEAGTYYVKVGAVRTGGLYLAYPTVKDPPARWMPWT